MYFEIEFHYLHYKRTEPKMSRNTAGLSGEKQSKKTVDKPILH